MLYASNASGPNITVATYRKTKGIHSLSALGQSVSTFFPLEEKKLKGFSGSDICKDTDSWMSSQSLKPLYQVVLYQA
ncbi:hypothetical protein K1719_018972 [Acacia pycnantha]|nr:hypothetical protein K1719_018972 [Acacia pycnantha]